MSNPFGDLLMPMSARNKSPELEDDFGTDFTKKTINSPGKNLFD